MRTSLRVVIADDHPLYLEAVAQVVRRLPETELVGSAGSGAEAIELVRRRRPDLLVLDYDLGDLSGLDVLAALEHDGVAVRVLVVTGGVSTEAVYRLVEAGATGLLEKDATFEEVGDAIRSVGRGETVLGPKAAAAIASGVRERRGEAPFSDREQTILRGLARGLSAPEIGRELHLSGSTVKTHLQRLYEKLGVSDRAAAVAEGMRRRLID